MAEKEISGAVLSKSSPFTNLSYVKGQNVKGFVGRKNELAQMFLRLKNVIDAKRSFALRIAGPGGSGKSTLFGYFCQDIEESMQGKGTDTHFKEYIIFPSFIDAPKGEKTTFRYIWQSIINSLLGVFPQMRGEFFEILAVFLITKLLKIIYYQGKDSAVLSIMEEIFPRFSEQIEKFPWDDLVNIVALYTHENFFKSQFLPKSKALIARNWRFLSRIEVTLRNGERRFFKPELRYIEPLFNILDYDITKSQPVLESLNGTTSAFLTSDKEIITFLNWVIQTWEWILEKPVAFVVGVDNLGYLTLDLPANENPYDHFLQTLLMMREDLKNFLFVLIGTTDDWEALDKYVLTKKDYPHQIAGFITQRIDLDRLNKEEYLEAFRFIMLDFWNRAKLAPDPITFPFSKDFFSYLFDFRLHKFRDILNDLNYIWDQMQRQNQIQIFNEPFEIVRYIRSQSDHFKFLESFSAASLLPFERSALIEKWAKIESSFADKDRSKLIEKELTAFIDILKEKEIPRQIALVQQTPGIQYVENEKVQTRYPDIFVQLFNPATIDETHNFEIQVKIHSEKSLVTLEELKGSLGCLENQKTDALILLITGPGLEPRVLEYIKTSNLSQRIFSANPLNQEQKIALLYLAFYRQIMEQEPTIEVVLSTLDRIFGQSWNEILHRIRNMAPYNFGKSNTRSEGPEPKLSGLDSVLKQSKSKTKQSKSEVEPPSQTSPPPGMNPINSDASSPMNGSQSSIPQEPPKSSPATTIPASTPPSPAPVSTPPSPAPASSQPATPPSDPLSIVLTRYQPSQKEVLLICNLALSRTDRYKGFITKDYLKKNVPLELKEEQCRIVFDQLKKDVEKRTELLFSFKGASLVITELGKRYQHHFECN